MENINSNRKIFIITSGAALILIIVIIIYFLTRSTSPIQEEPRISPTPEISQQVEPSVTQPEIKITEASPSPKITEQIGPEAGSVNISIDKNLEMIDLAIAELSKNKHYEGKYFTMDYDPAKDRYTVVIQAGSKEAGDEEFDNFLKNKGIPNRSDIRRLTVEYK